MTIEEMKLIKKEKGYSYEKISELSGVPLGTIQKVFSGKTENPRYDTLLALEELFSKHPRVMEAATRYHVAELSPEEEEKTYHYGIGKYTLEDYYALPEERRVELIDGWFYDMASPATFHQMIAGEIHRQIANYILDQDGECIPFISPVDVQLDCDSRTMVEPDVAVLCDRNKLERRCIFGAPDFVLEVISPATKKKDYVKKVHKYNDAGVREYWILDPYQKKLLVYFFEDEACCPVIYGMNEPVEIRIYEGKLKIQFTHIMKWIEEYVDKEDDKNN